MTDNKKIGAIGLLALLLGGGAGVFLTPEEFDNAYYCSVSDQVAFFDRLSSTGKTGYYLSDGVEVSMPCRSGATYQSWVRLKDHCSTHGLDCQRFVQTTNPEPQIVKYEWSCDPQGCQPTKCTIA